MAEATAWTTTSCGPGSANRSGRNSPVRGAVHQSATASSPLIREYTGRRPRRGERGRLGPFDVALEQHVGTARPEARVAEGERLAQSADPEIAHTLYTLAKHF